MSTVGSNSKMFEESRKWCEDCIYSVDCQCNSCVYGCIRSIDYQCGSCLVDFSRKRREVIEICLSSVSSKNSSNWPPITILIEEKKSDESVVEFDYAIPDLMKEFELSVVYCKIVVNMPLQVAFHLLDQMLDSKGASTKCMIIGNTITQGMLFQFPFDPGLNVLAITHSNSMVGVYSECMEMYCEVRLVTKISYQIAPYVFDQVFRFTELRGVLRSDPKLNSSSASEMLDIFKGCDSELKSKLVLRTEYVLGTYWELLIAALAQKLQQDLKENPSSYPIDEILHCHIDNPRHIIECTVVLRAQLPMLKWPNLLMKTYVQNLVLRIIAQRGIFCLLRQRR